MLSQLEEAIADQIRQPLAELGVKVVVSPDSDNGDRAMTRGRLIVGYTGSSFSAPPSKSVGLQRRTLEWELSLDYKDLQTHKANYVVIEKILDLLTGFQPLDCDDKFGELYPARDGFIANQEGYWKYSIKFAMQVDYPI